MLIIIIAMLVAFTIAYLATPLMIFVARKYGLVDDKNKRPHPAHTHQGIIPRGGGVPVFISFFIAALIFIPVTKILIGILLGGFLVMAIGLLDDRFDLSPYLRFFLNIAIVGIVILFGLGIPYISNPLGGVIRLDSLVWTLNFLGTHKFIVFSNLFSIVWIVAIMNFVNWSKGVDGQMPGFVAISSFFLGALALRFTGHDIGSFSVAILAFIVAGSYIGFLPWNFYPQKIMPGYGGGALAGFLLGVLSILSWGKLGTIMLVLSVPLIDALYVICRRVIYLRSPFKGDAGHFHHRLLALGWGKRRIAIFYWAVSFLFGFASLFFKGLEKALAIFLVFVSLAGFIVIIDKIKKINSA